MAEKLKPFSHKVVIGKIQVDYLKWGTAIGERIIVMDEAIESYLDIALKHQSKLYDDLISRTMDADKNLRREGLLNEEELR